MTAVKNDIFGELILCFFEHLNILLRKICQLLTILEQYRKGFREFIISLRTLKKSRDFSELKPFLASL